MLNESFSQLLKGSADDFSPGPARGHIVSRSDPDCQSSCIAMKDMPNHVVTGIKGVTSCDLIRCFIWLSKWLSGALMPETLTEPAVSKAGQVWF